jgi:hypothetical protein
VTLFRSRLTAYAERWVQWYDTHIHTSQSNAVPPQIMNGLVYIGFEYDFSLLYHIHTAIDEMITLLTAMRQGSAIAPWSSLQTARPPRRRATAVEARRDASPSPGTANFPVRDGLHAEAGMWMPHSPVRARVDDAQNAETPGGQPRANAAQPQEGGAGAAGDSPPDSDADPMDEGGRREDMGEATDLRTGPEFDLSGDATT